MRDAKYNFSQVVTVATSSIADKPHLPSRELKPLQILMYSPPVSCPPDLSSPRMQSCFSRQNIIYFDNYYNNLKLNRKITSCRSRMSSRIASTASMLNERRLMCIASLSPLQKVVFSNFNLYYFSEKSGKEMMVVLRLGHGKWPRKIDHIFLWYPCWVSFCLKLAVKSVQSSFRYFSLLLRFS